MNEPKWILPKGAASIKAIGKGWVKVIEYTGPAPIIISTPPQYVNTPLWRAINVNDEKKKPNLSQGRRSDLERHHTKIEESSTQTSEGEA